MHEQGIHTRKPAPESSLGGDLPGASRLAVEAVAGLAGLVETVHANVARLPEGLTRLWGAKGTNLLSFLFSADIGVLLGYLPARRAARMDPIEALRYESDAGVSVRARHR